MRVALAGPPQSGKSTLFAAVAEAGGSHVDLHRRDQVHLAVVKVPDERLDWLCERYQPKKRTPAELEVLDVPGLDLSDEAGRTRARAHWGELRQSDLLAFVVREFLNPAVPPYRSRIDPEADVEELRTEMLFADLDQATARVQKLEALLRKSGPQHDEHLRELELMQRLARALEEGKPLAQALPPGSETALQSFAFLSLKPAMTLVNCGEGALREPAPAETGGLPSLRVSAKIEEEMAQLPPAERAEFLADLGLSAPARDVLVRACHRRLRLASFFTVGETECRAWSVPDGTDAVTAAGCVHTDMARGFIRAEVVPYADLHAAGDMKAARAAGKVRLEGKGYAVRDGDVIYFRFHV